jgi:hypothetical protein
MPPRGPPRREFNLRPGVDVDRGRRRDTVERSEFAVHEGAARGEELAEVGAVGEHQTVDEEFDLATQTWAEGAGDLRKQRRVALQCVELPEAQILGEERP